ncbi:MAG TPA: glycosyltransferase family 1 protein [Croceibacterium sp.]
MLIAYHSDMYARRERFGLARYSHSLKQVFDTMGIATIPFSTENDFGDDRPKWLTDSGFRQLPVRRKFLAPAWTLAGAPKVERWLPPFDILHSIDVDYAAPSRKPWVASFHDIGPVTHPHFFSASHPWLLHEYLKQVARKADRIIVTSTATAEAMDGYLATKLGDRMVTILDGVGEEFFLPPPAEAVAAAEAIIPAGTPYFLFSGNMNPRKNLPRVLRAFAKVAPEIPHHLVLVGKLGWDPAVLTETLAEVADTGRVHLPGFVEDAVLRALLRRADGYLYPSLYEGFGLPILEAMAAGCPVVAGRNTSMPEVAGDAAILVDAESEDEIAGAIEALATDAQMAASLRARGLERAKTFTWQRTGEQTAELYRQLV